MIRDNGNTETRPTWLPLGSTEKETESSEGRHRFTPECAPEKRRKEKKKKDFADIRIVRVCFQGKILKRLQP